MAERFRDSLAHATGGRRYCFAVMSFHEGDALFERIRSIITDETGVECISAEDIKTGDDIREKVHYAIDNAAFVLADLTTLRPNLFYELGYAVARGRPVILLAKDGADVPTDLKGLELIRYLDSGHRRPQLERDLRLWARIHATSNVSMTRAMVVPNDPAPSIILASPKFPTPASEFTLHPVETATYGDYLGIRGVFSAYASVFGEHLAPELLSASHASKDLPNWDASMFVIGSNKVNRHADAFLSLVQADRSPRWRFIRCSQEPPEKTDYEVHLKSDRWESPCWFGIPLDQRPNYDFGLIARGPHPKHQNRMITIMAGPHSLGSAAACLAATRTALIRQIADRLGSQINLAAQDRAFWVLVRGEKGADGHLSHEAVTIEEVGVYVGSAERGGQQTDDNDLHSQTGVP